MALISAVNAQGFKLGILVKPNISMNRVESPKRDTLLEVLSGTSKMQFTGGLAFDLFFAENYAIGSGLAFATKGSGTITKPKIGKDTSVNSVSSAQYVDIPLTLKLFFGDNVKTYVQLGVAVDVLISAKGGTEGSDKSFLWDSSKNVVVTKASSKTEEINYSEFISTLDLPLRLGIGMSFPMGAGGSRFFFSLQYDRGLMSSYSDNGGKKGGVKDLSIMNDLFGLELGVSF